jgi:hypothetical protein
MQIRMRVETAQRKILTCQYTFGQVFSMLDAKHFEACFVRWVGGLCQRLEGKVVAIDGKTVRRSHRLCQGAIHRLPCSWLQSNWPPHPAPRYHVSNWR